MKRFITLFTLLFVAVSLFSQRTADRFMTLGCSISQSGASSGKPHVSCNCVDQGGTYDASNVQVGDSLMFVDGGVGYKMPIDSIVTPGSPTVVVRVDWSGLGLAMIPTGSGAISRGATNGKDSDVAGLSAGDAQVFKEDNVSNYNFNNNRTYVTSDSFTTFVPSTPAPQEGDLVLSLPKGNWYQKVSGNWTRKSLENGTTAASIYNAGSVDTLTWNGNLYRHVRVNAGSRDTVHIDFPTNMATQFVGSTYLIGVQNGVNALTVTWDTLYGKFDYTDMPNQTLSVNSTINYQFRVVADGSEGVRLQWVDGGQGGAGVTDGDKGDIDVTGSGLTWTIDTSAVVWNSLSQAVKDSINAGAAGIDTLWSYTALRAYTGTANAIVVKDFTHTYNAESFTTYGGLFFRVPSGTENGGTLIAASNGVKWKRLFDGVTYSPMWWQVGGYDQDGNASGIDTDAMRINAASRAGGEGAAIILPKNYTFSDLDESISAFPSQTWEGNGATIKQSNQIFSTLADSASVGDNTFTLTDASSFRAGHEVVIRKCRANGCGSLRLTITDVTLNTITTSATDTVTTSFDMGDTVVVVVEAMVKVGAQDGFGNPPTFRNMYFDGNAENNDLVQSWLHNNQLKAGEDIICENVRFVASSSVSVQVAQGDFINCKWGAAATDYPGTYKRMAGGAVHMSNGDGSRLKGIFYLNCESDSTNVISSDTLGHEAGLFVTSSQARIEVQGGWYRNGFERIITSSGDDILISIKDAKFQYFEDIASFGATTADVNNIHIRGGYFHTCGDLIFNNTGSNQFRDCSIREMVIYNGRLNVQKADGFIEENCIWREDRSGSWAGYPDTGPGNHYAHHSYIDVKNTTIKDNYIEVDTTYQGNVAHGILLRTPSAKVSGSNDYATSGIRVLNNHIKYFRFGLGSTYFSLTSSQTGRWVDWIYSGNQVVTVGNTVTEGFGILVNPGQVATNNVVYLMKSGSNFYGMVVAGVHDSSGTEDELEGGFATNNFVKGLNVAGKGILIGSTVSTTNEHNAYVKNNFCVGGITDNTSGNSFVQFNTVLSTSIFPSLTSYTTPKIVD